ncbi:MAG TPA: hypothetical protein VGI10_10010 [Polyangiaceae bacterium]|jgi:hypothetical protein
MLRRRAGIGLSLLLTNAFSGTASAQVMIASQTALKVEIELGHVLGGASSASWLSARVPSADRIAIVTPDGATLPSSAASDAWLRALDFASRVRVAPPGDFALACQGRAPELADSGLPEAARIAASSSDLVGSDLELRRALEQGQLDVNVDDLAAFEAAALAPYRISWFEAPSTGGATSALALASSESTQPPTIWLEKCSGTLNLLALSERALSPTAGSVSDTSTLRVLYRGLQGSSDYRAAVDEETLTTPDGWLREAVVPAPWFGFVALAGWGVIDPVSTRYVENALSSSAADACVAQIQSAWLANSQRTTDYQCMGASDLSRALQVLDFHDPVLSRYSGALRSARVLALAGAELASEAPLLVATDVDASGCAVGTVNGSPTGGPSNGESAGGVPLGGVSESPSGSSGSDVSVDTNTYVDASGGGDSDEGCGTSSPGTGQGEQEPPSAGSSDSCSGDSSDGQGSSDSCSGDSSDGQDSSDSCSGDSSDGSKDSSGCSSNSHSGSSGDTCSGSSPGSASATQEWLSNSRGGKRKPKLRVSMLSMLGCAFMLPLRRRSRRNRIGCSRRVSLLARETVERKVGHRRRKQREELRQK